MNEQHITSNNAKDLSDEVYVFPVSFAQQRLWFLDRLDPGNTYYNVSKAFRLIGALDVQSLEKAFRDIVQRHEVLRTHFEERDGKPVQVISRNTSTKVPLEDLTILPAQQRPGTVETMIREAIRQPFDLGKGPLIRSCLWKLADREHVLLITMHHIISDAWSMGILWNELSGLYRAHRHQALPSLPELPIQYADFTMWQRERLQGDVLDVQLNYWKRQLADLTTLGLPMDRPRPARPGYLGAQHPVRLSPESSDALKRIGMDSGATLFMTLLTLFQILLSRFSGSQDIAVGSPIASRNRAEIEPLIGFFVNTLVLRADLSGNPSFREALERVRYTCFDAYDHQDLPLERLVEELLPPRDLGRHPLFQVMFTLQNTPNQSPVLEDLTVVKEVEIPVETARFDLTLSLVDAPDGVSGFLIYNTDLFDASSIARMAESFEVLAASASAEPNRRIGSFPLLTEAASHRLLVEWNATEADYPKDQSIHQLFEKQVMRTPNDTALIFNDQQLTYAELNTKANQLANYLRSLGVGPDVFVGLCLERSTEMVVGLLAILKAGGAYVPLDPSYPNKRLAFLLEDLKNHVILTQRAFLERLPDHGAQIVCLDTFDPQSDPAHCVDRNPNSGVSSHNLAYVLYTSGSTGQPKGVMVEHGSLLNYLCWVNERLVPDRACRLPLVTNLTFDACLKQLFAPLLRGDHVWILPPEISAHPNELIQVLGEHKKVGLNCVPSLWTAILDQIDSGRNETSLSGLTQLFLGGEPVSKDLLNRTLVSLPQLQIWNLYGPTEATANASAGILISEDTINIGRPIANTCIYILDGQLQPACVGVPGEIHIGGVGLARGYLNQPELTAEKFIPNPFSEQPGARLYRTGDLARYLPDGSIEFLGRLDHQIKIRGFRIEPGEIEAALRQHRAVRETVVLAREDQPDDIRLVAYIVPDLKQKPAVSELRSYLKQKLPNYMVPSAFVLLDVLPLTPNGKVDRRALPDPNTDRTETGSGYVAPKTTVQEILSGEWRRILRIQRVGIHDNFFELGGHSLLAARMMSQVQAAFGLEVPLRLLFEQPTVAGLAEYISKNMPHDHSPPMVPITRAPYMPMSFAQRRLWFLDQFESGLPLYNIPLAVRLEGLLDYEALEYAFNEIVRRHESLRTTFRLVDGEPMQIIAPARNTALSVVDLSEMAEVDRTETMTRMIQEESGQPFDLARGPLLRAKLLRQASEQHVLLITMHHIISDGWSMGILRRELSELYHAHRHAAPSPLPDLPIQYADFAIWQRDWLQGNVLDVQLDYWKRQLADLTTLQLPLDRPRPSTPGYAGAQHQVRFSPESSDALKRMGRREGTTLFMTLLTLFQILLSRFSGSQDIAVGAPIANRNRTEIEPLIGFFVNTLVLRADLSGNPSFREALERVRDVCFDAYDHQDLPFERLVEELLPARDASRHPLFQVMLTLQNRTNQALDLEDLNVQAMDIQSETARFDLILSLVDTPDGISGSFTFNTDLFDPPSIERMAESFVVLAENAAADPDCPIEQLSCLSAGIRRQLLVDWNDTGITFTSEQCLHEIFDAQAMRTPDSVAVVCEDQHFTYRELEERANQLGNYLRSLGVGPDVLVGICLERSLEMVTAVLGVLKAGGAYVPLDPGYPKDRLAFMIADARLSVLLTQERLIDILPEHDARTVCLDSDWNSIAMYPATQSHSTTTLENLAYVIFTSGSTGRPKGVMVPHRAICNHVFWIQREYPLKAGDAVMLMTQLSFDPSVSSIFAPLTAGARLILPDPKKHLDNAYLGRLINEQQITMFLSVPSVIRLLLEEASVGDWISIKHVFCGGEAMPADLPCEFRRKLPHAKLHNAYGPTEATIITTVWTCGPDHIQKTVPIGYPVDNNTVYVVDTYLQPVPIGVPGELLIGGKGLARGYLNRPELTAERFIAHPFIDKPGERVYRSGDLVRWSADGALEYLGRIDHQVKIRGFRIELGEIESVLNEHPAIRECVVLLREDVPEDKRLTAYVVLQDGDPPPMEKLHQHLRAKLPDYMLPSAYVRLDQFPINTHGKIDRNALVAPDTYYRPLDTPYLAPSSSIEKKMVQIWKKLLNVEVVGVADNFFLLGGHSLLAVKLLARVSAAFGVEVPLRLFFEQPTVAGLASLVSKSTADDLAPLLRPVTRKPHMPMSFAQRRLWFLDQFQPGLSLYNIPLAVRLDGVLDYEALEYAFNELVRRHESLRTTFQMLDGEPMQVIAPDPSTALSIVDLSEMPDVDRNDAMNRIVHEESRQPFDLAQGPLLRVKMLRPASEQHILLITMHHIISDGWSMDILWKELSELYRARRRGAPSPLPELPIQYADFAVWQRDRLQGEVLDVQLDYWKRQLADLTTLQLPLDRPRPSTPGYAGDRHPLRLSPAASHALKRIGQDSGATLFMTLLALFQVLLSRFSGSQDVAVGTPIASRNREEIEPLIGFFVNTLVLRTDLSDNPSFRDALERARDICFDAYDHQDLPFERLVEELLPPRDASRHPLFQVMFTLQNTQDQAIDLEDLTVRPMDIPFKIAKFDLTLFLRDASEGISGVFEYSTDLFDASSIARMAESFAALAENAAADPDRPIEQLSCLSADMRRHLLVDWNDTAAPYPSERCIHELFEEQARRSPDAVALIFNDRRIRYGELNDRANQLAHHLLALGIGPNVPVGVYLERSPETVIAVLAVLKAGGAYMPLDPAYPKERIRFMLEDAAAPVVITGETLLEHLPAGTGHIVCMEREQAVLGRQPVNDPDNRTNPDHLANIIYTSGSTGVPKGVEVRHRGVTRLVFGNDYVHFGPDEIFLQMAPMSFDASTFELWGSLLHGGTCIIYPERVPSTGVLGETIARHGVTTLWLTASLFNAVIDEAAGILTGVRQLLTGGESLSVAHVKRALEVLPNTHLVNGYGPTESTTFTCCYPIPRPLDSHLGSVPIGRPIGNTRVYLLNAGMQPVPVGVAGEVYIGGDGLARGYRHRPELTAESFVPDPFSHEPGARLYRTGDLARYLPDGNIEFLGRIDEQIKIRGFRIEPGEIEAALMQHPAVHEAVVLARKDMPGDIRLVAYAVLNPLQSCSAGELRGYLEQKLPGYMVPAAFVLLDALPLTPNGKVDRRALPAPDQAQAAFNTNFLAPRNSLEIHLAKIWEKALGIQAVGIKDNFFDLGGHSLMGIRVISQIKKYTGKEIAVADIFKYPTIEQLAQVIKSKGWTPPYSFLVPFQPLGSKPPFICIHGAAAEAANRIGLEQPFYVGVPHGLFGQRIPATVEEMAIEYIKEIKMLQPEGPYFIGGYSFGGLLAFEIAHQLKDQGKEIALLALIDATPKGEIENNKDNGSQHAHNQDRSSSITSYAIRVSKRFMGINPREKINYVIKGVWRRMVKNTGIERKTIEYICRFCIFAGLLVPERLRPRYRGLSFRKAARKYSQRKYAGHAILLKVGNEENNLEEFWKRQIEGDLEVHELPPGDHLDVFEMPQVEVLARKLKTCLEKAQNQTQSN